MKIILAFDSFKGCLSAPDVCKAACEGIKSVSPKAEVVSLPLSDGGEGLVNFFLSLGKAIRIQVWVHGPLMEKVLATYALSEDGQTAYIEMASACGLTLVPIEKRDVMKATTYGLGELLLNAKKRGVTHIVLGIGGSATCDAGIGMLEALGNDTLDGIQLTVACDVINPLYGYDGAAYVFAPQKGASPEQVKLLDGRLRSFARHTEKKGLSVCSDAMKPGTGAAGGLGYALQTYLHAQLRSGIDVILDACSFDRVLDSTDLVITGEGCSDNQTVRGKVAAGVLRRAKNHQVKTVLMSGQIKDREILQNYGFDYLACVNEGDGRPLEQLLQPAVATGNIRDCAKRLISKFFVEK